MFWRGSFFESIQRKYTVLLNNSESSILDRLLFVITERHEMSANKAKKNGELAKTKLHTAIAKWAQLIAVRAVKEGSVSLDQIPRLACELREVKTQNAEILENGKSGHIELENWEIEELMKNTALCRVMTKKCHDNLYCI
jgi:hypothetical protein